jgi:hypothetical protein
MHIRVLCLTALLFGATALANDDAERAKLAGTWQLEGGTDAGATWVLEDKVTSFHITRSEGNQKVADYECTILGKECQVKDAGKALKVSLYFSGPKLVQMETRGSAVVKREFSMAGPADSMQMSVTSIVPSGKEETSHLKRVQVSAAR